MPDSVSEERRKLVNHYGAEVILIHDAGNIGECIENCLKTALDMQKNDKNVKVGNIDRFDFYDRAKQAYAVIATGEEAVYANIILKKGVIK